jgi:hypothetical protein
VYLVVVHSVGKAVQSDPRRHFREVPPHLLLGLVRDMKSVPPLARWDSFWFYGIAQNGYSGEWEGKRSAPAFLPVYPLLMAAMGTAVGIDYIDAGLLVSGAATWASCLLLMAYVADQGGSPRSARNALLALLSFPTAFILASVYAEALFLAFSLGTFILARRGQNAAAAATAFCAGLTRNHGLALVAAMLAAAWQKRRTGEYSWRAYVPGLGGIASYVLLATYHWSLSGDPLRFLNAKRLRLGNSLVPPWTTLLNEINRLDSALQQGGLGSLYVILEFALFYAALGACGLFIMRKSWPEAVFTGSVLAMSLLSGSLWGLPRFFLLVFPVFAMVGASRSAAVWRPLYYLIGALLQGCLLVNYVDFLPPAP